MFLYKNVKLTLFFKSFAKSSICFCKSGLAILDILKEIAWKQRELHHEQINQFLTFVIYHFGVFLFNTSTTCPHPLYNSPSGVCI